MVQGVVVERKVHAVGPTCTSGDRDDLQGEDRQRTWNFEEKVILARQPYIRASDLEEHGMTRGCPKPPALQHLQDESHC